MMTNDGAIAALRTAARLLIDNRDRADAQAARITDAARARGADFDSRIQYAEGSAHAYGMACAILAGSAGVADVQELAGVDWRPTRDMTAVVAPDGVRAAPVAVAPDGGVVLGPVRCAFCPHSHERHTHRTDIGAWCLDCNDDLGDAGPCSGYFIAVHPFVGSSTVQPGPHGTTHPGDCRTCGLGDANRAHDV